MSYEELTNAVSTRLDEGDRGDRAWWLLTRVHLNSVRVSKISSYLHDVGGENEFELSHNHYREIAHLLGIVSATPAQTINRHYFLAMLSPLRLIERLVGNRWAVIRLTANGARLATDPNVSGTFERVLSDIRFCREPWYPPGRVHEYRDFDLRPYNAALSVMQACGGYIDTDEFDLFVSRIRNNDEIAWASGHIPAFRELTAAQKQDLLAEVENRIPPGGGRDPRKPYQNWRDMGRHTFSLFALGQSATRAENTLLLSVSLVEAPARPAAGEEQPQPAAQQARPARIAVARTRTLLRIPETETPGELLSPPVSAEANTGSEAENLVGKMLAAAGWEVVYYNNRRGYGFDIWAKKDDTAFVIEVKSSLGAASSITLTRLEYEAAQHHEQNYLLVIVEELTSEDPIIRVVQDPANVLNFARSEQVEYRVAPVDWRPVAIGGLPQD